MGQRVARSRRPRPARRIDPHDAACGLLDPSLRTSGEARTFAQKWDQIEPRGRIEREWTKAQILEAYLNLVAYRGD
jgi:hypothetical protein